MPSIPVHQLIPTEETHRSDPPSLTHVDERNEEYERDHLPRQGIDKRERQHEQQHRRRLLHVNNNDIRHGRLPGVSTGLFFLGAPGGRLTRPAPSLPAGPSCCSPSPASYSDPTVNLWATDHDELTAGPTASIHPIRLNLNNVLLISCALPSDPSRRSTIHAHDQRQTKLDHPASPTSARRITAMACVSSTDLR